MRQAISGSRRFGLRGVLATTGVVLFLVLGVTVASAAKSPAVAPGAPTGVTAVAGDEQATISFTPSASSGSKPVTSFRVTVSPGGDSVSGTSSPLVLDGLENGRSATFTVVAISAAGASAPSAPSPAVTPASPDAQPLVVTSRSARAGDDGDRRELTFSRDRGRDSDGEDARPVFAEATAPQGALVSFTVPARPAGAGATTCSTRAAGTITSPAQFPLGTTVVTCSRLDRKGRSEKVSFPVIVRDRTAPALALPADSSTTTASPLGTRVSFTATATDLVSGSLTPTCAPPSGSLFAIGTTSVVCSVADARGNRATGAFTITVVLVSADSTPPVVTVPAPLTVEATGPAGATAAFSASALDAVDGVRATTCAPPSGSVFALGTTTVVCTAADVAGNSGSASFTVSVTDTTPPALSPVSAVTVEAVGPLGAPVSPPLPLASDLVGGARPVVCSTATTFGTLPLVFPLGSTLVTCTAGDASGNTSSSTFTVKVVDTTAPVIDSGAAANASGEATSPAGAAVTFTAPGATDAVSGALATVCVPASGSTFPLGLSTVTCTATDAAGNAALSTLNVLVTDTTAPTVTAPRP